MIDVYLFHVPVYMYFYPVVCQKWQNEPVKPYVIKIDCMVDIWRRFTLLFPRVLVNEYMHG